MLLDMVASRASVFLFFEPFGRPRFLLTGFKPWAAISASRSNVFLFFDPLGRPLPRLTTTTSDDASASRSRVFLFFEPAGRPLFPGAQDVFCVSDTAAFLTTVCFFCFFFFSGGSVPDSGGVDRFFVSYSVVVNGINNDFLNRIACFAVMLISDVVCNIASIYRRVPAFNGCIKTNPLHTDHQY